MLNTEKRYDFLKRGGDIDEGDSLAWEGLGKKQVTSEVDPHQVSEVYQRIWGRPF